MRSEPCACGTFVVCITDNEGIVLGVSAHQLTPEHQQYRIAMGYPPKAPRGSYSAYPPRQHVPPIFPVR